MADEAQPARSMSLVPYSVTGREVVLQQGGAIVIYDNQSRSLSVRYDNDIAKDDGECPFCHRPFREQFASNEQGRHAESVRTPHDRSYVDPEYFRMLAQSQRPSPAESGAATPLHRFAQFIPRALRSGRSRDVSGSQPPVDGEFVASEPSPSSGQGISSSAFSPGYFKQLFREERELGRGGYGVVLLVEHILDGFSLGQFACKRIPVGNDHRWLEKVLVEVKLLTQVSHPNLVKYHWVWVEEYQPSTFGPKIPCVWILQQYCNAGDLHRYVIGPKDDTGSAERQKAQHRRRSQGRLTPADLLQRGSRLTLEEIFSFFKDITSGLHHLHSKGYIHRDVKPSNCLLLTDEGRTRVLLSDFGEVQAAGTRRGNTGATGTISYCAPEVLTMNDTTGRFGDFTTKSDVFSLGMIVYFMCFGRLPYHNAAEGDEDEDKEDLEMLRAEITGWQGFNNLTRSRQDLPERLYKYLQRLLSVDPNERPSTEEILASIKANSNLADTQPHQKNIRVTPLDAPLRARTKSATRSQLDEHIPSGLQHSRARDGRSTSPEVRSKTAEQLNAMKLRPLSERNTSSRDSSQMRSPRLMLPPPPNRSTPIISMFNKGHDFALQHLVRSAVLIVKLATLLTSCSPVLPRPLILYSVLVSSVLEAALLDCRASLAIVSLALHLIIIWTLREHDMLCERPLSVEVVL